MINLTYLKTNRFANGNKKSGQENLGRFTHARSVMGHTRAPLEYFKYTKINLIKQVLVLLIPYESQHF